MNHAWTPTERAFLRQHYPRGSVSWIAEQLGTTRDNVYAVAKFMGLKRDADAARLAKRFAQRERHRRRSGDPTPEEIAARAAELRLTAKWQRNHRETVFWEAREVRVGR